MEQTAPALMRGRGHAPHHQVHGALPIGRLQGCDALPVILGERIESLGDERHRILEVADVAKDFRGSEGEPTRDGRVGFGVGQFAAEGDQPRGARPLEGGGLAWPQRCGLGLPYPDLHGVHVTRRAHDRPNLHPHPLAAPGTQHHVHGMSGFLDADHDRADLLREQAVTAQPGHRGPGARLPIGGDERGSCMGSKSLDEQRARPAASR